MKSKELQSTPYGFIDASRTIRKLSEVCVPKDGIQTGPFGSQLHSSDYVADGTPIITVEHLGENIIEGKKPPLVNAEDVKRLIKYTLKEGDIVFSRVGSVDRRALVSKVQNGWMFSGRLLRVRPEPLLVDPRYLSYFFGLPMFKTYIRSIAVGATMPSLNTGLLSEIPVILPSISEQRAIGNVLSALDEKIRINNALSKTLEDFAQIIFKSWFIDFDPVKAKMMREKPSGIDAATAALFPDSMQESELGSIPFGWQVESIGSIASIYQGKYLKPIDMSPTRDMDFPNPVEGATKVLGYSSKSSFDFNFSSVSCRGSCGFVRWISSPAWISNNLMAVYGKGEIKINYYLHYLLKSLNFESITTGSVQGQITISNLSSVRIILDIKLAKIFNDLIEPIHDALTTLERQSASFAEMRDTLLPRLISGELKIPEEMFAS
jgi:type I restriction enzyme S subunit